MRTAVAKGIAGSFRPDQADLDSVYLKKPAFSLPQLLCGTQDETMFFL
jgi:hypothetical protein